MRIWCIELYMVTWFKNTFIHFSEIFKKRPRSVNNFRTEHLGGYFWDFWSPYVAESRTASPDLPESRIMPGTATLMPHAPNS